MFVGGAPEKSTSLWHPPALLANIRLGWKSLVKDKQSSLSQIFVNYGHKKFYETRPRPLKTNQSDSKSLKGLTLGNPF